MVKPSLTPEHRTSTAAATAAATAGRHRGPPPLPLPLMVSREREITCLVVMTVVFFSTKTVPLLHPMVSRSTIARVSSIQKPFSPSYRSHYTFINPFYILFHNLHLRAFLSRHHYDVPARISVGPRSSTTPCTSMWVYSNVFAHLYNLTRIPF